MGRLLGMGSGKWVNIYGWGLLLNLERLSFRIIWSTFRADLSDQGWGQGRGGREIATVVIGYTYRPLKRVDLTGDVHIMSKLKPPPYYY